MKENDFFAVALNTEGTGLSPEDLRGYGINPNNTGLQSKDYYKDIPRVQERFQTSDGQFDDIAYSAFYDSLRRTYSDFAQNDYIDDLLSRVPASAEDIFSLGNLNLNDDTVRIINGRDPNRHQIGIGNIFQTGKATFSEREVAQAYNVLDENEKELDWSPNDKGGIFKALFRPTLALAAWDEEGYHTENGRKVFHRKGEHKYDENGNPRYQTVSGEIYDKEILHWGDTVTKEGTWLNKIDPFDFDSVRTSPGKIIYSTFVRLLPYLTPVGDLFGALEASKALAKTIPVIAKSINGVFSTNDNAFGKTMTSVENWAKRFDQSTSDEAEGKFFAFENIMQQVVDSAKQLYSQGLIQKIPGMLSKHPSMKSMKIAGALSTAYLATTSAEDVYGDYIRAGVNEKWAGIGALATMGAFYGFMSNEYFKEFLFNDPAIELPELKKVVRNEIKTSMQAVEKRIAENEKVAVEAVKKGLLPTWTGEKWYNKTYNAVAGALNKVAPKIINKDNAYLVRGFNEGLEEVMEEGATDLIKGLTLGARSLGFNIKDDNVDNVDFGFSPEDFMTRYAQAFVGGAFGGVIFEGLQQWNNKVLHRKQRLISDLNLDEQLAWYIRNGRTNELLDIVDNFEKKGKFGSKNLSLEYTIEDNKIIWNSSDDENNNQNTQLANALRQKIRTIQSELIALDFVDSDNELLQKAVSTIQKEAKSEGYKDVNEYKEKRLRDEKIDFLKQRQVDKLILSDIADLQYQMRILKEGIDKRKSDLITKAADGHAPTEEELKRDSVIKIKQEKFDAAKEALDEILKGTHANEYLGLGLFAGDDRLVDLYLTRKTEDGRKSYYITDLKKYVRAKYGANLDELIEKAGGRDENGKSEIEEFFKQEYDAWVDAKDDLFKIREAYNLHKHLGKIINPIVKEQIKNYSGYKSDPDRLDLINLMMDGPAKEKAVTEYETASKAVDDYVNANKLKFAPFLNTEGKINDLDAAMVADPTFANLVNVFKKAEANLAFFNDPRTALDRAFNEGDGAKKELLDLLSLDNPKELFNFLERYYTHLNNEKIVSEFSDDFYRIGIATVANKLKNSIQARLKNNRNIILRDAYTIPDAFDAAIELIANTTELAGIYVDDIQLSDTDEPETHSLKEIFEYFSDNIAGDSSREFFFNGKVGRITDHLVDNFNYEDGAIRSNLDDADQDILDSLFDSLISSNPEIQAIVNARNNELARDDSDFVDALDYAIKNQNQNNSSIVDEGTWQSIVSRLNGILQSFETDPDFAIESYNGAIEMIQGLIDEGTFNPGMSAKDWIDRMLFDTSPNIVDEVTKLKAIRSNMVHTPIVDWIRALSSEFGGTKQDLLDLLEKEIKGLITSKTVDDYVINNPYVKDELEYLENALNAAAAVLQGSAPLRGANFFINQLIENEDDKLPELMNETLSDVYAQDLQTMSDRVSALNELNRRNSKGIVRMRQEAMAVSAPKLFKDFLKKSDNPSEDPKDNPFWIGQFKRILDIDINQMWNDRFDLDTVTVDNLDQFWSAVRAFMNELYDAVSKLDWVKICDENDGQSVNSILAEVLFGRVTEAWRLKNSTVDNNPNTPISDIDVGLFMAAVLSMDPRETFGRMKAASEDPSINRKPFWDQMMAISIGFGKTQNRELFNEIGKLIWLSQEAKAENPGDPDFSSMDAKNGQSARDYFAARPLIEYALNIDGASGTGKSTVVLKFIHYMNEQDSEKPVTMVCAKYGKRMKALQSILGTSDDSCFTFTEICKKFIGRELTADDFENNAVSGSKLNGHSQQLKAETIQYIKDHINLGTEGIINIYIDESGLFSEAELVFFSEVAKLGKVNLIFAGDKMQNGATTSTGETSGIIDTVILGTPRLNISMRVGNWGMISNLNMLETDLETVSAVIQNTPWITSEAANLELNGVLQPRSFKYTEKSDAIYGFMVVDDGITALERLKSYKKNPDTKVKIAVITDNPGKYSAHASSDIDIISIEEVQGGEYDYVLSDIERIDETRPDNYYKKVYTIISRAKTGGYIVNGLGSKFNTSSPDPLAATIINPSSDVNEATDTSLAKYNNWWIEKLMKDDVWGAPISSTSGTSSTTSGTSSSTSGGASSSTTGAASTTGGIGSGKGSSVTGTGSVTIPDFDEDTFIKNVLDAKNDDEALELFTSYQSKQKRDDIRNYREYHKHIDGHGDDGTLIDYKSYIDWLFEESDDILFGNNSYNVASATLQDESKNKVRELIRNLALDFFQLSGKELRDKWEGFNSPRGEWINMGDEFAELANGLRDYMINSGNNPKVYAVKDGNYSYLYIIIGSKAIPIARIKGGTQTGWVTVDKASLRELTPLTMLSSDGRAVKDPYDDKFSRYANISKQSFVLVLNPQEVDFSDEDTKRFVNHVRGIGQVVVQSIFGVSSNTYLTPDKTGTTYNRVDSTGTTKGKARFMAVSKHITFETYLKLAGYLSELWHKHSLSNEKLQELQGYVTQRDYNELSQFEDDIQRLKTFRKSSILQPRNRDLLVTALMRYFSGDSVNAVTKDKFFSNFNTWLSSGEYSVKDPNTGAVVQRQRGVKFSLTDKFGSYIDFHIILNDDKKTYSVYYKVFDIDATEEIEDVLIDNLESADYFNFTKTDPVVVAKDLLSKIINVINERTKYADSAPDSEKEEKEKNKQKYSHFLAFVANYLSDPNYEDLFKQGRISFGLTTKRIKKVDGDKNDYHWFSPFDSDIAELFKDISYSSDMEDFLKQDSVFKYNIIVGVRLDTNQEDPSGIWLTSEQDAKHTWSWDIIDLIPPLYQLGRVDEIEDISGLPTLGNLGHIGSTDDKTKISVDIKQDDNVEIIGYKFDKNFRISKDDLSNYINTDSLSASTEFEIREITKVGDNFVLHVDGRKVRISEDKIKMLLDGMFIKKPETDTLLDNGEWKLRKVSDGVRLVYTDGSGFKNISIANYSNGTLLLFTDGNIVEFSNVSQETVKSLQLNELSPNTDFLGNDNENLWFYDKTNNKLIRFNNNAKIEQIVSVAGNNVLLDGILVNDIPESILSKLKPLLPTRPVSPNVVEKAKELFAGIADLDFNDDLLKYNPDAWAFKNAEKLDGIYTWNDKKWVKISGKQLKWAYAKIVAQETGISPIESYTDIDKKGYSVHGPSNETFSIDGRSFKVERVGDGYILTELIKTNASVEKFISDVKELNNEQITDIFSELAELHAKENTGKPYNAQRMGELYAELATLSTDPKIGKLYGFFETEIADILDDTIECKIK